MADPVLNPFWTATYGITTWSQFHEEVEPGFSVLFPTSLLAGPKDAAERDAAVFPGSAFGVYAAGFLTSQGYLGSDGAGPATAVSSAAGQATQMANGSSEVPSLIIPNAFQVSINAQSGGQVVTNVIGVTNAAGTAQAAATAVKNAWEASSGPLHQLSSLVTMTDYKAVDLSSEFGDIYDLPSTTAGGQASSNSLSTNAACALIQWNGSVRSRSTRGRLYFGPLMESQINADGRTLTTTWITNLNTVFAAFLTSLSSAGYPLAVLSRKNLAAYPVTAAGCETVIATQRRRIRS